MPWCPVPLALKVMFLYLPSHNLAEFGLQSPSHTICAAVEGLTEPTGVIPAD